MADAFVLVCSIHIPLFPVVWFAGRKRKVKPRGKSYHKSTNDLKAAVRPSCSLLFNFPACKEFFREILRFQMERMSYRIVLDISEFYVISIA